MLPVKNRRQLNAHFNDILRPKIANWTNQCKKMLQKKHSPLCQLVLKKGQTPRPLRGELWAYVLGSNTYVRIYLTECFVFIKNQFPFKLGYRVLGKIEKSCSDHGSYRWQAGLQRCPIDCDQWRSIFCLWRYSLSDYVVLFTWHRNQSNDSNGFHQFGQIEAIRRSTVWDCTISWHLYVWWAQIDRIIEIKILYAMRWFFLFPAAPFCYIFNSPIQLYFTFRAFFVRYCHRLTTINTHSQGIVGLCLLFEKLLQTHEPQLWSHFRELQIQPWVVCCFKYSGQW